MKFLKFFKKKSADSTIKKRIYVDNPRYYTQLYASSELKLPTYSKKDLKKIKKRRRKGKLREFFEKIKLSVLKFLSFKFVLVILPVFVLLFSSYIFKNINFFNVSEISVVGNKQISNEEIYNILSKYQNKNLFNFSARDIEQEIKENLSLVKEVYVWKYLPNKLSVEVVERKPSFVITTLDASHIVDIDNTVILQIPNERFDLIKFEREVLRGEASIDDTYVKEQFFINLELKEGEEAPKWEEVPIEEKQKLFEQLKENTLNKVRTFLESQRDILPEQFKDLPLMILYTDQVFPVRQKVNDEQVAFSNEALIKLSKISFKIDRVVWTSQFTAEFILTDGKVLLLSRLRPLDDQVQDLNLLLQNISFEKFTRFDVRVPTIAVE
ncbi:MAG: hypothetical protein KatS3mg085_238 [Candidatus Dojkabacteria bacterium]|nr:MAG: hypothetical protein KatS3mg085_238 [Candidatus Dojkabacteria bacterium]